MSESVPAIDPESPVAGELINVVVKPQKSEKASSDSGKMSGKPEFAKVATGQRTAIGESGGPEGPEPTRFGDWERKGRCIDF